MAQPDLLKRYLDAGMAFTQLTRDRAEAIVRDLVKAGELQREQAQERVEDLLDRSRRNTEAIVDLVRREVADQLGNLGIATKDDIAKLEAKIKTGSPAKAAPAAPAAKATKTPAKAPAKKAPAAKSAAKSSAKGR